MALQDDVTALSNYIQLEMPRRPALWTYELLSYNGDPNGGGAPVQLQAAPKGTYYLRETDHSLWRKEATGATTWVNMDESGSSNATALMSPITYTCSSGLNVGDFVWMDLTTAYLIDTSDPSKMPARGVVVSKPTSTTATVQLWGLVSGIFASMVPNATYLIGVQKLVDSIPTTPSGTTFCRQVAGFALSDTVLYFNPQPDIFEYVIP